MGTYESTSDLACDSEMPSRSSLGTGGPGLQRQVAIMSAILA